MAYEIVGETVKSATSIKIGEIFKTEVIENGKTVYKYPKRYKENITKQSYPNFHIIQVNLSNEFASTHGQRAVISKDNRIKLDYLINVQYRVAENLETITNLQQQLDDIGLRLCTELTELDLELPTKTYNRRYEKVDGILQMFFNVTVYGTIEELEGEKMNNLYNDIKIKEEN